MLRGHIDVANFQKVCGWAWDETEPDAAVRLQIFDNDQLLGSVRADRFREDLKKKGFGNGHHAFEFLFSRELPPVVEHLLRVCRESDGAHLAGSPYTLEPMPASDSAWQHDEPRSGSNYDQLGRSDPGFVKASMTERHSPRRQPAFRTGRHALIIDERIPRVDRDAGSHAILSHMRSLQRLDYEITFTPSVEFAATREDRDTLDAIGVTLCASPFYGSVEEVLQSQAGKFKLIYMHRVSSAAKYAGLVRHHNPAAKLIYSVADLHHLRFARQADVEGRPELLGYSRWMRFLEYVATVSTHVVITHSPYEAQILAKDVSAKRIRIVPWSVASRPTQCAFGDRRGVAFIGGYNHAPNLDAARFLIAEIMPAVRRQGPDIECYLVGSDMPGHLSSLCGEGVVAVGHVSDLAEIFDRIRLTVAPLNFGAGIKGKVLDSLAAGIPCVCSPIAAEGLEFPDVLQSCVAEGVDKLAGLICHLHNDEEANDACARAGLDYISTKYSDERLDAAMRGAVASLYRIPDKRP